ncbi:hypothetical protein D3C78_1567180 [compost metagenome]
MQPVSVNLMALFNKLDNTCCNRTGSPEMRSGTFCSIKQYSPNRFFTTSGK